VLVMGALPEVVAVVIAVAAVAVVVIALVIVWILLPDDGRETCPAFFCVSVTLIACTEEG
jgi:hypothetical protein